MVQNNTGRYRQRAGILFLVWYGLCMCACVLVASASLNIPPFPRLMLFFVHKLRQPNALLPPFFCAYTSRVVPSPGPPIRHADSFFLFSFSFERRRRRVENCYLAFRVFRFRRPRGLKRPRISNSGSVSRSQSYCASNAPKFAKIRSFSTPLFYVKVFVRAFLMTLASN